MIEMKNNFEDIVRKFKNKTDEFEKGIEKGFQLGLRSFESYLIKNQLSGRKNKDYGLNRLTGIASNSLGIKVYQEENDLVGKITVNKNAWYLKVHQHYKFNGYINVKNATALTVPISQSAKGRNAKEFKLFMIKRPGKPPLLVRQIGKDKIDIMYVLKPKVYIPQRLYFYEEFKTIGNKTIKNQIEKQIKKLADQFK